MPILSDKAPLILVVDDDAGIRLLAGVSLKNAGYDTIEAANGEEGVAAFDAHRPDLILMDAVMPGMDGFSATREIRKLPCGERVPIVMMTGLDDLDSIHQAYGEGVTDFVVKPIHWVVLGYRVGYILRANRAFLELARSEEKTRALMRAIPDLIFRFGEDGIVLDMVAGGEKGVSSSDRQLTGRSLPEVLPAGAAEQAPWYAEEARRTGAVQRFEYELSSGSESRHFEAQVVSVMDGETLFISRDMTERKRVEERLAYMAYHDALTGLANRVTFKEGLEREIANAKRRKEVVGVVLFDLDRFKEVNDTLGHAAGDRLLIAVAERLKSVVRETDTVARISGDEFTVILPGQVDPRGAIEACRRIRESFSAPFVLDGQLVNVTASLGISVYPHDGDTPDALVKNADIAMFRAKAEGRDTYKAFSEEMSVAVAERAQIEKGLRAAIEKNEFVVHYQPVIDLKSGRIVGAEGLVRWQSPGRGLVPPMQFIPLAEETGTIIPISEWVLRTAYRQAMEWKARWRSPFRMAVNVSARLFQKYDLPATILEILERTGIEPESLELEITESIAMQNLESTLKTLWKLHQFSIQVAMDDFGTGYSSLACLRKLPIHTLKIDRAFIGEMDRNPEDQTIVKAILAMAGALNIKVVAEGVERAEQRDLLKEFGCHQAQGFFFSRPVPAEEFARLLERNLTEAPETTSCP